LTLAITVCLEDGAILISDSLLSLFPSNNNSRSYVEKVTQITETIGCIEFGVCNATKEALRQLDRERIRNYLAPFEVLSEVSRAVKKGWEDFLRDSSYQSIDTNNPHLKAGLLVAGYIPKTNSGGFIGGVLASNQGVYEPIIKTNPNHRIILGGEENNSHSIFDQFASEGLNQVNSLPIPNNLQTLNKPSKAYLQAGAKTIKTLESINSMIGGLTQYSILRRGHKILRGILNPS